MWLLIQKLMKKNLLHQFSIFFNPYRNVRRKNCEKIKLVDKNVSQSKKNRTFELKKNYIENFSPGAQGPSEMHSQKISELCVLQVDRSGANTRNFLLFN